ncbi:hypothetical protein GGI03_007942, partial [Coemansia sp. RSA 2337]
MSISMWGISVELVLQSSLLPNGAKDPLYFGSRVTVPVTVKAQKDSNPLKTRVYEGTARLYDPGVYAIEAR